MTSTTTSKKGIIDFLWEWTESQGEWAKLLIDTVVKTESALTIEDRQQVFDYFLDSLRKKRQLDALSISKPKYSPTAKAIHLKRLKDISGVNRLAKEQVINFNKNLTIIYGENGTGKTGYGRILKSLGISYDPKNIIHHNIYGTAEAKSATIEYEINGNSATFPWSDSALDPTLNNISVFNNQCVQLSLIDRQLIVSPMGFHLFNIVTSELSALTTMLRDKIGTYQIAVQWIEALHDGTPQKQFIGTLNKSSTEQRLAELSSFSPAHQAELEKKEKELGNLNPQLLQMQIANLTAQEREVNEIIGKIKTTKSRLNTDAWTFLIGINKSIAKLESQTQTGIKEIGESNGIAFYESKEFQEFITSADAYIKLLDKPEYPKADDVCVYCNQPLQTKAQELLSKYKKLLNDTTQQDLAKFLMQKNELIKGLQSLDISFLVKSHAFGIDETGTAIQPEILKKFTEEITQLRTTFLTKNASPGSAFSFDYDNYINALEETKEGILQSLKDKSVTLSEIIPKESKTKSDIYELLDRKLLSEKFAEIKSIILNIQAVAVLNSKAAGFNTNAISRKTTEAREELVEQNFDDIFKKELGLLRKSNLNIELNFGTDKGKSKIVQRLKTFSLSEILSEGEQKAIALAEFLTELQLDHTKAPVIFDDPVNSLDHRITDEVGKRLIKLSKDRQVVIFTHSILLLNSLIQQSDLKTSKKTDFTFYSLKNNFDLTGIIGDVEEVNSYKDYISKLNNVLNNTDKNADEATLAAAGYGHLRAAIEVCVEESVLQSVIKRYRKGVAFPSLLRINGKELDQTKTQLNDIYEKCCVSIDGHSSPEQIDTAPTIAELKVDYDNFIELRKKFT